MLIQYFPSQAIQATPSVKDWREAIDIATRPLLSSGAITREYVDAIKKSIAAPGGTYIDLGSEIAMAHARPESGVTRTALSVLNVKKPFLLSDSPDHPIRTLFCLAAQDANTHIELMQGLASLLGDEDARSALTSADTPESLTKALSLPHRP